MNWVFCEKHGSYTMDLGGEVLYVVHLGEDKWRWSLFQKSGQWGEANTCLAGGDVKSSAEGKKIAEDCHRKWKVVSARDQDFTPIRTKMQLAEALFKNGTAQICVKDREGYLVRGILQSAQRENGSGKSFNLTILGGNGERTIYWESID